MDANQTYHDANERAARNLRRIEALLAEHAKRQAETPVNWGHVGYMQLAASELAELVELPGRTTSTKETLS
jgi:hypothetical protein